MRQVALVGNPNCGKTTLLNALTGANLSVGNWPGVTVERKQARLALPGGGEMMLNDLPGLYALPPYSVEERVSCDYLASGEPDLLLNIVDASCIERNLYLTTQLIELGRPVVVALNLMDALEGAGGRVDEGALQRALGVPVVAISAAKKQGLDRLLQAIEAAPYGDGPLRIEPPPQAFGAFQAKAGERYRMIGRALSQARYAPPKPAPSRLDNVCLNRFLAYPLFFALMALMFFLTFGPVGSALTQLLEHLVARTAALMGGLLRQAGVAAPIRSLLLDGALAGVGGVICFLPQILLLFLFLTALEDSGYMARAAFLADRPLRGLGLSGRAFIPLLMGFGCTTSAVVSARSVDDERDRRMTIMLLPFMSCGAKLPVYALFGAAFFGQRQALVVLALYLLGMLVMALTGALLGRAGWRSGAPFVLELPPYRTPQLSNVGCRLWMRAKDFLKRAGTLIFLMSLFVWLLQSLTPQLRWAESAEQSLFGRLGALMAPAMAPLGLGDWRKCVALLSGLVAKEAVVSTFTVLLRAGDSGRLVATLPQYFTTASAASFLVFTLLYPPCLSALAAMRRELGSRRLTALSVAIQLGAAYALALITYQFARLLFP